MAGSLSERARRVRVETTSTGAVIQTAAYRLKIVTARPRALLSDARGATWSELSLLASVDRVDARDESDRIDAIRVEPDGDDVLIITTCASTAWESRRTVLRCTDAAIRVTVEVTGGGDIGEVTLLGGRAVLPSGAAGVFRSRTDFASVFVPAPTEPVSAVRSASAAAEIGVVGDAEPGRLHGIFSPPPLCYAFGREGALEPTALPEGDWLAAWVAAPVDELGFTGFGYSPLDGGFLLQLDYEGHTRVHGAWRSPELVLAPVGSPVEAVEAHRDDLIVRGWAPGTASAPEPWWLEPIFCGWGAQCAEAAMRSRAAGDAERPHDAVSLAPASEALAGDGFVLPAGAQAAPDLSRHELYDRWLARLADRGIDPGTVVVDDRWQADYGTNTVDVGKWPDLKGWIASQHRQGRRVLLWFKAWDPSGLDADLTVTDRHGRPVSADPGNPGYRLALEQRVHALLSPNGLDADGFKVDFTQRAPSGASLRSWGDEHPESNGVWGVAALHRLLACLRAAAKAAKPDALLVTHAVHPSFADASDMIRLNDVLEKDSQGRPVPVVDQLVFRWRIAHAALPGHPIDTDQWPMPNRSEWLAYARRQSDLGVPALYYVESIDNSGEPISDADLDVIAASWRRYREGLAT